jgi:hypothetical protein
MYDHFHMSKINVFLLAYRMESPLFLVIRELLPSSEVTLHFLENFKVLIILRTTTFVTTQCKFFGLWNKSSRNLSFQNVQTMFAWIRYLFVVGKIHITM